MIYCIWYPAGGFGHFINAILTLHGENFKRPKVDNYTFDLLGTSHSLPLVAPKYLYNQAEYNFKFSPAENYSVLIDNGNFDETQSFRNFFPDSKVIKICYSEWSWPIFAKTTIIKTTGKNFEEEVNTDTVWNNNQEWAIREKYFLYLRDHSFRFMWKEDASCFNLLIDDLLDYHTFKCKLESFGIKISNFKNLWSSWFDNNQNYIQPVLQSREILNLVKNKKSFDLSSIKDIWTQAILYYMIWLEYQFEVPHNDYSNWFTNTTDIVTMLDNHGVTI